MSTLARRRNRDSNIWPGFVDALATLLMVIIFVLMIFIVAQFYLTQILSGKDETLARLNQQVAELSDLLSLEREANAEMRVTVAQLSAELQNSISTRESLTSQINLLSAARDSLETRLAQMVAERAVLQDKLSAMEADQAGIDARLLEAIDERNALIGKLAAVEEKAAIAVKERDSLATDLDEALTLIDANRDTIELQLADLERLRRDIAALRATREDLEAQISDFDRVRTALNEANKALSTTDERIAILMGEIDTADVKITELTALKDEQLARIEEMLAELASRDKTIVDLQDALTSERDTRAKLEARLADEQERTQLAQTTLEERDIRLEELLSEFGELEVKLTEEERLSAAAQEQVALLNQQIAALRRQMAGIQQALEASEALNASQNVKILDLGKRLNAALATKVQELARFRSEFFGRLREVLSDRDDVRIVGDRFVFQSEVLFASGKADIGEAGQAKLGQLAATLKTISGEIPDTIDWILQVEGHTDTIPISNAEFANNWELSAARAISVVEFLIEQGIPARRLSAAGYGEFRPIDPTQLDRNRRIELKLTQR
jgi:chemotaxis protein MotB